jgi:hypothetical protein
MKVHNQRKSEMAKKREFKVASWADHHGGNMLFWVEDQHGNKYGRIVPSEGEAIEELEDCRIRETRSGYDLEAAE